MGLLERLIEFDFLRFLDGAEIAIPRTSQRIVSLDLHNNKINKVFFFVARLGAKVL
jgi:hypothetical protein